MAALLASLAGMACKQAPPRPPAMAVVSGRVVDENGEPLPGSPVILSVDPDDGRVPIASIRTDAQGWFRAERIPPGSFEIHARAPGHVEAVQPIQVGATGTGVVELRLAPAVALRGRIEDGRHTAIPMARVVAFAASDAGVPRLHETRSDERGAFAITDLAAGPHRLLIEAPGLGAASAGPIQAPDPDVLVVLPGEIRVLIGRVSRDGEPARGAKVRLGGESVLEPRTAETDGEGRFSFSGLGPGNYVLRAELGALVSPVVTETVEQRAPVPARLVALPLAPGRFATGVVTDEAGHPVAGATIQLDQVPPTGLWPPLPATTAGKWATPPLGPGTYRFRARSPGFVARRNATVEIAPVEAGGAATTTAVKLDLARTGRISGIVVNDKNAPLAGATVYDRLADTEELGVIWSRLPLAAEAAALPSGAILPSVAQADGTGSRRVQSDAAGRFLLRDVPPGRVRVEVLSAGRVPLRTPPVTLAPGAALDVGRLHIQGAIQLSGTVVDVDGTPVSGARVTAAGVGATGVGPVGDIGTGSGLYALTGSDGAFMLPLGTGEHRLTASARGRADISATVRVTVGTPPPSVTLRFAQGGSLTLSGVVRDTAGRPLAHARVTARSLEGDPSFSEGTAPTTAPATTDAGGGFRLAGLPPGPVRVEIVAERYGTYRTTLIPDAEGSGGTPAVVAVPIPGAIEGEVHERITGAPVPAFQIDAEGPDGASAHFPEGRPKKHGADPLRFSLRKLPPGPWTLHLKAPGFRPLVRQVEVASAPNPGETSVRDLRLEMAR